MESLFTCVSAHRDKIACIEENGAETGYDVLVNEALKLSERIGDKKKLILVYCRQNLEAIVGYLAARLGGHTALLLDSDLSKNLLTTLIQIYRPNYAWKPREDSEYELVCLSKDPHPHLNPQLSILLSTSGSTGSPKMVRLSERNLLKNAVSIIGCLPIRADDRPIISLPFQYAYGLSVLNTHLQAGATLLLAETPVIQGKFWQFFKSGQATSFSGVPYTYEMLKRIKFKDMHLPSLRYMTQAGGKMHVELVREFLELAELKGYEFYVMYGQTEATARIACLPYRKLREKIGSIGLPIPEGRWWLQNPDKTKIDSFNQQGELIYSGPNAMMGYADSAEDLARGDDLGGVLETGDLAYFDQEGYCYITGRLKRFIKLFGKRFSLDDIQQSLTRAGMESVAGGSDNRLLIATTRHEKVDAISRYLIDEYKIHHSVIEVFPVDGFPMGTNGKLLYGELFARLSENRGFEAS